MSEKQDLMEAMSVIVNLRQIRPPDCCEYCRYREMYLDNLCAILRMGWDSSIDEIEKNKFLESHICDRYQK